MASTPNWLITQYSHSWVDTELDIFLLTDVPVHLTLCYTDKPERMHLRTKIKRGEPLPAVPYYCFTECIPVEQDEPGDTTEHTFVIPDWFPCQRRWWRFTGTIGGVESPSTSPIFTAHYGEQEEAVALKHTALEEKEPGGVIDHADQSVTPSKLAVPFTFAAFPFTPPAPPTQDYHVSNKKYVDDQMVGGGFWELLASTVLLADSPTITFITIPARKLLRVLLVGSHYDTGGQFWAYIRINNDSGNNYFWSRRSLGTTYFYSQAAGADWIPIGLLNPVNYANLLDISITNLSAARHALIYAQGARNFTAVDLINGEWSNEVDLVDRVDLLSPDKAFSAGTTAWLMGRA